MDKVIKHIQKELKKHLIDYLILFSGGIIFLVFISMFRGQRDKTFLSILTFSGFYMLWGIFHHMKEGVLHLKIVLEYVLIGFIVLLFLKIIILY